MRKLRTKKKKKSSQQLQHRGKLDEKFDGILIEFHIASTAYFRSARILAFLLIRFHMEREKIGSTGVLCFFFVCVRFVFLVLPATIFFPFASTPHKFEFQLDNILIFTRTTSWVRTGMKWDDIQMHIYKCV